MKHIFATMFLLLSITITACTPQTTTPISPTQAVPDASPTPRATATLRPLPNLSITLGTVSDEQGIALMQGGDIDTMVTQKGDLVIDTLATGNGLVLPGQDGNTTPDSYIQFNVSDAALSAGTPTHHLRLEVVYFDEGTDTFSLQYDSQNDPFAGGGLVAKTNTLAFKTAVFNLCDAFFNNRGNGGDFRIADNADGADYFSAVRIIGLPDTTAQTILVDDFGANPFDDQPDSDAIQSSLDSTCSGDTVVFTSSGGDGYQGYLIDRTLFLTGASAKHNMTFTASNPDQHALLKATTDLKGYVVRLYSRSRINNPGAIDNIDFGNIDINGGRDVRVCLGPDNIDNGVGDNWGSWLPECSAGADPWCSPGILGMDGGMNWDDTEQAYDLHPQQWTTGVHVHDLRLEQGECGSSLAFFSAAGEINNVTIDTVGDHVHAPGCTNTDPDGDYGGWSDGITLFGPGHTVTNNTVINPSDIGIVFFGGKNTTISNNTIQVTEGNYGAFGGIALHPWIFGDISGLQITGNTITSLGNQVCGGLHTGINLGTHMWGGGCVGNSSPSLFGNPGTCTVDPALAEVTACTGGRCQLWAYSPVGSTVTMKDNVVTGAHINYLIEGLAVLGEFIDENNISIAPQRSDWQAAHDGCNGVTWGSKDKVAHHPALEGYIDLSVHCER